MAQVGLEERMARIEGAFTKIDQRLARMETELFEIRGGLGSLRREIQNV